MKYIHKGVAPRELQDWFNGQPIENGDRLNCSYDDMPRDVKQAIQQHLLAEQGWLCCYTGIRVDEARSHIEHFKPQCYCERHEDIDYTNLLAAYPGNRPCSFGAKAKGDWYDEHLLVNPLHPACETRFRYNLSGHINPADENDHGAVETIQRLRLYDESLTQMREQAIDEALFPRNHQLSEAQLRTVIESYCRRSNLGQPFRTFCFVVAQAAQELLRKAERNRIRRQAIRNQVRR
jgi:uncharacterized protein (TIGR02646 family)